MAGSKFSLFSIAFALGTRLLAQPAPCSDPNTWTPLCQPAPQPQPEGASPTRGVFTPIGEVEAVLEDGGKPPSRPDFVYAAPCYRSYPSAGPCLVRIFLKGFREAVAPVNSRGKTVVVLQRLGAEGQAYPKNAVDVGMLSIPPEAHQAYAKGEVEMGLHNLPEAEKCFRLAVKEFPGHALAWDELGLALELLGKPEEARSAYQSSIAADPRFARPLVHLAGMAVLENRWEEAGDLTARALALAPADFPRAFCYDALANFNLKHLRRAEESARQTIGLDPSHTFVIVEYILGMILVGKGDQTGAAAHLSTFLTLAPQDRLGAAARRRLAELTTTVAR